jgi:hypothetical protein
MRIERALDALGLSRPAAPASPPAPINPEAARL